MSTASKMRASFFGAVLAALQLITLVNALPTISTYGSKFYTANGDQFFIKGIAYQLSQADPLIDTAQCQRDAALMQKLGANTIRVYHVDSSVDHSGCMSAFDSVGIYLFVDLDTFTSQINQTNPKWTQPQESAFKAVMDEFQQYSNTAGFFIGNEVVTYANQSEAAVFVKAATRDLKAYRDSKGYRQIPIGYSHADIANLRPNLQNYLACGSDPTAAVDFFGLNAYEWCGSSSYHVSGYQNLTNLIKGVNIPFFLSEDGCNLPEPRTFQDQNAVFGPKMTPYWSGAIIYEWIQEANRYGLITYGHYTNALSSIAATHTKFVTSGTPTPVTPDFSNLLSVWKTNTPSGTPSAQYTPQLTTPSCPAYTPKMWLVDGNVKLPTLGQTYNQRVQYSITAGHPETKAAQTGGGGGKSNGAASGRGLSSPLDTAILTSLAGLAITMLGFVMWL